MEVITTPEGVSETFICRCSTAGNQDAEALMAEVRQRLAQGSGDLVPHEITDRNFATMVVTSLWWDYSAGITGIHTDQWSLITATGPGGHEARVQCDEVEDGFAAVWKIYADRAAQS